MWKTAHTTKRIRSLFPIRSFWEKCFSRFFLFDLERKRKEFPTDTNGTQQATGDEENLITEINFFGKARRAESERSRRTCVHSLGSRAFALEKGERIINSCHVKSRH